MNPQLKQSSGTRSGGKKQNPQLVYCLCLDLTGSTKAGLSLTSQQNDKFNLAFVKQIGPHYEKLVLGPDFTLKFTGDGWLFMTAEVGKLPDLCCLALIQAKRFQREMSELTHRDPAQIPPLRIALCNGRDVSVQLPNHLSDWVGDSARRAVRAAGYCENKTSQTEILVDEAVQEAVHRDFQMERIDITKRVSVKPSEEELSLWQLIDLKPETYSQLDDPPQFFYTACMIGMEKEVDKVVERFIDQASEITDREKRGKFFIDLDILIRSLPSPSARKMQARKNAKEIG